MGCSKLLRELLEDFLGLIKRNKKEFVGGMQGLIFAILVLLIGFFKTLFIIISIILGIIINRTENKKEKLRKVIRRIFTSPHID